MVITTTVDENFNGNFEVIIRRVVGNDVELQYPIVEDGVKWETERQGSPAKLTFKLYSDKNGALNFHEGDEVILTFDKGNNKFLIVFHGYIFTKKRTKDGWINVTAYDALRYFKNKASYVYYDKTASEVVRMICEDYKIPIGVIEDTGYIISERKEDNQSLIDVIQNALDLTLINTSQKYVLLTEDGKVSLKNAKNLMSNIVINASVAEDFDYSSSIDNETYNEVELYYDNDKTNKREFYNAYDEYNIKRWGRLRLTESLQNTTNVKDKATKLLKLYNQKQRELKVKEAFGDISCRAGASAIVQLELGDIVVSNYMIIEKATHTFKKNEYRMDLTLIGFPVDATGETVYDETNVIPVASVTPVVDLSKQNKTPQPNSTLKEYDTITIKINNYDSEYAGKVRISYRDKEDNGTSCIISSATQHFQIRNDSHSEVTIMVVNKNGHSCQLIGDTRSNFTFVDSTPGFVFDEMIPNGIIDTLTTSYYHVTEGKSGNLTFNMKWVR